VATTIIYVLAALGIPNFVGMVFGTPVVLLIGKIRSWTDYRARPENLSEAIFAGLAYGIGCGFVDVLLVRLCGKTAPIFGVPTISGIWTLFLSTRRSKMEAFASIVGIFGLWAAYWLWLGIPALIKQSPAFPM
jgi:hypothetical protein